VEKASNKGTTPLLVACLANQTAVALDLLKAKADPNRRWYGTSGDTPLNFAQVRVRVRVTARARVRVRA